MLVPASAIKSVVFIGNVDDKGEFIPRATGFLVRANLPGSVLLPYLITAEHVVTGMQSSGLEI